MSSKKGFTIVETVIVLAIAGLIFAVVFIGIPQLQESRRDAQRRGDLDTFVALLDEARAARGDAQSTVGGTYGVYNYKYPFLTSAGTQSNWGIRNYCNEYLYDNLGQDGAHDWKDPTTNSGYVCTWTGSLNPALGNVHYAWNRYCDGGTVITASPTDRTIGAAWMSLENGGYYCKDFAQ